MNRVIQILFSLLFFVFSFSSCSSSEDTPYQKEIKEWHKERVERLTEPTGWLSLAGLHWLEEGENTFGKSDENKITFKVAEAPEVIGSYFLEGDKIIFKSAEGVNVISDSAEVTDIEVFADVPGKPTLLEWGTLSWFIIKRGDKYGIRLRDTANPNLANFVGIEMYAIDPAWRVEAQYVAFEQPRKIAIPNILGMIDEEDSFGELQFQINGKKYSLATTGKKTPYFLIFADMTNGRETYGAGRFLVVEGTDSTGKTYVDFNKAYNPPCGFTKYATCPLPPEENKLKVEITAGEYAYHGAH